MTDNTWEGLKKALEKEDWPLEYPFKFIVPSEQVNVLNQLLPEVEVQTRFSSNAKFVSVSFSLNCESPEDVLAIYDKLKAIPGLISL